MEKNTKYKIDHDYHIHTNLSPCSGSPEQMPNRILEYANEMEYSSICLTDHFWDSDAPGVPFDYRNLNYELLSSLKPLPQSEEIKFFFGCEAEINSKGQLGIAPANCDLFDFIIFPTTHMHMNGISIDENDVKTLEDRAFQWVRRFDLVLNAPLPFHKVGIAHPVCRLMAPAPYKVEDIVKILNMIPDNEMERVFEKSAKYGIGIELNASDFKFKDEYEEYILRPFKIAKDCGCKFYLGSDAHSPAGFDGVKEYFERAVDLLCLEEKDKFRLE